MSGRPGQRHTPEIWALGSSFAVVFGFVVAIPDANAGLVIFLPENATYRYVNATAATTVSSVPANWYEPGFDDSSWFTGIGPFGGSIFNLSNARGPQTPDVPGFPVQTPWHVNHDPYLRTSFSLPQPMDLTLWLAVDNGIEGAYLNGVQATAAVNREGVASRWEHVFDIPAAYTFAGINTLTIQLEDHGVQTGFALVITENDLAANPVFSNNPPPTAVPEPATSWLVVVIIIAWIAVKALRRGVVGGSGQQMETLQHPHVESATLIPAMRGGCGI